MPFQPLAVVEQDAPEKISRRELDDYKAHLLTLSPGKEHLIYVEKGAPVLRKVKAVDEKGEPRTQLDANTGKLVALYATVNGEPKIAGVEGVEYVMEDTKRGKLESKDATGLVAAGAEESINVNVKVTQKGRGKLVQNQAGVWEFVRDDQEPEITLLTVNRSTPRNDSPEGLLKKRAGLADGRMKKVQQQIIRATDASESFKTDLQTKVEQYKQESATARQQLKQLESAKTEDAYNKLLVKFELNKKDLSAEGAAS